MRWLRAARDSMPVARGVILDIRTGATVMTLKPDVLVRPTVAGIRAGRDEVLDRAVAWIRADVPEPIVRSR